MHSSTESAVGLMNVVTLQLTLYRAHTFNLRMGDFTITGMNEVLEEERTIRCTISFAFMFRARK